MPLIPKKSVEKLPPIDAAVLDQFGPAAGMSMADIDAATRRLKRALVERMRPGRMRKSCSSVMPDAPHIAPTR